MTSKITIFYSYSSADEKLRERLGQHLTSLRDSGFIDEYGTHQVDPGDVLSKSITTDLQKAQIILLLVSRNSLGSKDPLYQEELQQILKQFHEGKSRIIPILLRPYRLEGTPFAAFKRLPADGRPVMGRDDPDAAFDSIAQSLETLIKKLTKDDQVKEQVKDDQVKNNQAKEQAKEQAKDDTSVPLQSSLSDTSAPRTSYGVISEEKHLVIGILPYCIISVCIAFLSLSALNIIHLTWFFFIILILCFLLIVLVTFFWQLPRVARAERLSRVSEYCKSIFLSRRYRQRYREHLIREHQFSYVEDWGKRSSDSLELDQVYIELFLNSTAVYRATTNPFSSSETSQNEEPSFLKYLQYSLKKQSSRAVLVIIGPPGSGKRTLLKDFTLLLAQDKEDLQDEEDRKRKKDLHHFRDYLPVFLSFRDLVSHIKDNSSDFTLADAAYKHLQKKSAIGLPIAWFRHLLNQGRCFVLLDGLDDISDLVIRKQVIRWVHDQMNNFTKCHFILTSRAYAYKDCRLEGDSVRELRPFNKQQIGKFLKKWYYANQQKKAMPHKPDVQETAEKLANSLYWKICDDSNLLALAANPLLLTMIANIHSSGESLPDKRISLYEEICEAFLGKLQEERDGVEDFSFAVKQQILQSLAYYMMNVGKRELPLKEVKAVITECLSIVNTQYLSQDFIASIENKSGLLLEVNYGFYGFVHPTFQEFFAAMYIKGNSLEEELIKHRADAWWRETIHLYCALTDATSFIEACISGDTISGKALELALECQKEALSVQDSTRDKINALLFQSMESTNLEMRRVAAEALLNRRLRHMTHLQKSIHIDTSFISCAEYQIFLDNQAENGQFCQPDHWLEKSFPNGTGNQPVAGVRFADATAFCQWLTKRENGSWLYRLPTDAEAKIVLGGDRWTECKERKMGFWIQEKQVMWFQDPLSPEEITKEVGGKYNKAFMRVFHRTLDFDYISAVISKSNEVLKDSQRKMSSIPAKYAFAADESEYKNADSVLKNLHENADSALKNLKNALDKCRDRTLLSSASSEEASIISLKEEMHGIKSTAFFNVPHYLRPLIAYVEKVSFAQSSYYKRRWPFSNRSPSNPADVLKQAIDAYLDIHVIFLILELRLSNVWPAWEGILLVKERKDDSETNKLMATT